MIYKVTFHISTLYIYIKFHQLRNYHKKQENLLHDFILHTRNFLHENGKKILHDGEYQSRYIMKKNNIHNISYFIHYILLIKSSRIPVMKNNVNITYQVMGRQCISHKT